MANLAGTARTVGALLLDFMFFPDRNVQRSVRLVVPFVFTKQKHSVIHASGRDCTDRKSCVIGFSLSSVHHSFCFLFGQIRSVAECQDVITSDSV